MELAKAGWRTLRWQPHLPADVPNDEASQNREKHLIHNVGDRTADTHQGYEKQK